MKIKINTIQHLLTALIISCLFLIYSCKSVYTSKSDNFKVDEVKLVRQPYLQMAFKDSISILWNSNIGKTAVVKYGTLNNLDKSAKGIVLIDSSIVRNTVTLRGLERGKKYHYAIYSDDVLLASGEEYNFITEPPENDNKFSFYAMGDIGRSVSQAGFPEITAWQIHDLEKRPHFGIGLGDIIYPDGKSEFADEYLFTPLEPIMKNIPFYPALGNHDWHVEPDENFVTEWKLPNNEHYYSFDYANAHFIALDTRSGEMFDTKNQLIWFENDLKKAQGNYDWIIVYFHHNGITCSYKQEFQEVIDMYPLFAKYNVDLVLNGHAHTYERLMPFDKNGDVITRFNKPTDTYPEITDGFIQITTGAGGILRKGWVPNLEKCGKNIVAAYAHTGHFSLINIDGKKLELKAISSMGAMVLDSLYIDKN